VQILVLHGPNLNLLGRREPERYGRVTLSEIDARLRAAAESAGCELDSLQSNAEHELVERIHAAMDDGTDGIVINPAALTHTSVALRDALAAAGLPFIEVHLTNPDARESFRRSSYLADLAVGRVAGFGPQSYLLGLRGLLGLLDPTASE
jgi:3-dehydroquinate dehydratase-2